MLPREKLMAGKCVLQYLVISRTCELQFQFRLSQKSMPVGYGVPLLLLLLLLLLTLLHIQSCNMNFVIDYVESVPSLITASSTITS